MGQKGGLNVVRRPPKWGNFDLETLGWQLQLHCQGSLTSLTMFFFSQGIFRLNLHSLENEGSSKSWVM